MCKAPKPPKPESKEPKKPQFLRNRYLDAFMGESQAVNALRTGRSTLRIPLGSPSGIGGRQPGQSLVKAPPIVTTPPQRGRRPGIEDVHDRGIGPRANRR